MAQDNNFDYVAIGSLVLAILTACAGLLRIILISDTDKRFSTTTLTYFAVAGALLMLRQIKTLSFGDTKIELQALEKKVDQATELAKTAVDANGPPPAPKSEAAAAGLPHLETQVNSLEAKASNIKKGEVRNDPWKGQFGGLSIQNERQLSATVSPMIQDEDYFLVRMTVTSLTPLRPLTGRVQFFLHSSFRKNPIVPVLNGKAEFRVRSYGAFTVGAIADEGATLLELDLALDRAYPRKFRDS